VNVPSPHIYTMHAEYSCGIVKRNRFATVHCTIETCGDVEVLAHVLLIYGTIWTCVLSFAPRLPYPPSKVLFRHPLDRSYDLQSWNELCRENSLLTLPGIEPRFLSRSAGGLVTMRSQPWMSVTELRNTKLIMCITGVMWYLACLSN
jgi:hypothetical protein